MAHAAHLLDNAGSAQDESLDGHTAPAANPSLAILRLIRVRTISMAYYNKSILPYIRALHVLCSCREPFSAPWARLQLVPDGVPKLLRLDVQRSAGMLQLLDYMERVGYMHHFSLCISIMHNPCGQAALPVTTGNFAVQSATASGITIPFHPCLLLHHSCAPIWPSAWLPVWKKTRVTL